MRRRRRSFFSRRSFPPDLFGLALSFVHHTLCISITLIAYSIHTVAACSSHRRPSASEISKRIASNIPAQLGGPAMQGPAPRFLDGREASIGPLSSDATAPRQARHDLSPQRALHADQPSVSHQCHIDKLYSTPSRQIRPLPNRALHVLPPRQDQSASSPSPESNENPASSILTSGTPFSSSFSADPATVTATPSSSGSSAASDTLPFPSQTVSYNDSSSLVSTSSTASSSTTLYTGSPSSFSRPWQPSTKSTTSHAPEETPYVPGVILPLVLGGDDDDQAVYSVQMDFGHGTLDGGDVGGSSKRRRIAGGLQKRRPSTYWDGGSPQTVNLQVDLGSSDLVRGLAVVWAVDGRKHAAANTYVMSR